MAKLDRIAIEKALEEQSEPDKLAPEAPAELHEFQREFAMRFLAYKAPGAFWKGAKRAEFVAAFNKMHSQVAPPLRARPGLGAKTAPAKEPLLPLTVEHLDAMLSGRAGLVEEMVRPMSLVFNLFGDDRQSFEDKCAGAVAYEKARRHAAWLETPEGIAAKAKRLEQEAMRQQQQAREAEQWKAAAQQLLEREQAAQEQQRAAHEQEQQKLALERQRQAEQREQAEATLREQERRTTARKRANDRRRQQAEETYKAQVPVWRARNPEGMAEKQSFQEMLDTSVDKGENFVQFLFNRVLPEWNNLSQVKFCAHMERLNAENTMLSKKTLTDTVLSNWRLGKGKPLRDSAEVICAAFGITPREGERMALHERKLWKIIDGRPFSYGGKTGEQGLIAALADAHKTKDTSALITELIDSSGIRFERLQQVLGVQQISAWKKGARIDNVQTALDFVDMMGPLVPTELMTVSQRATRRELLSLITGREFDIDMLMENASKAGNPGGELLTGLTGRTGLVTITSAELAKKAKTKDFPVTEEQVKKMRTGTQLQRGGKIYEPVAKSILGQVRRAMRPLIAQDIVDPFTPEQEAAAIDMLTRIEHPRTLLAKCAKGEMAIGAMVRDTCERLNLNLMGPRSFCEQVGITHISDFVCGKAHVDANTAKKLSNWFAKNYGFTPGEQQQFMSLAQGVNQARTPDILLADVTAGKLDRTEGLRQIYDYRGFTRDALASQARVDTHVIQYSVNNVSGGRIMADKDAVRRIGAAAGISDAQLDSFVAVYDGQKIRRKDLVKKPAGRTKSWADTTSDTPPSTNGTPPRPGS